MKIERYSVEETSSKIVYCELEPKCYTNLLMDYFAVGRYKTTNATVDARS